MIVTPLREGRAVVGTSGPPPVLSPVHTTDVARALIHLLDVPAGTLAATGRDFLVVDDRPLDFDALVDEAAAALGVTARRRRLPLFAMRALAGPVMASYLTTRAAYRNTRLRSTGFAPRYPAIGDGLAEPDPTAHATTDSGGGR